LQNLWNLHSNSGSNLRIKNRSAVSVVCAEEMPAIRGTKTVFSYVSYRIIGASDLCDALMQREQMPL